MVNRRDFLGITLGAGATVALTPELLRALQRPGGKLIQRAIPSTGEKLPVIGLTLANHSACANPAALKEVLKTYVDNGGRLFDAAHLSAPSAEQATVRIVNELGVQNKLFLSWRGTPPGAPGGATPASVKAYVESLFGKFNVSRIDLIMAPVQHLAILQEMKKEGRVRYIGVGVGGNAGYPQLGSIMTMRNEPIDFVGVNYAIDNRSAELALLPYAEERKIAVVAHFPFGGANGLSCAGGVGLFARVANTPLPEWAAEFDAKSWAQFFLKYVVSHPAVTVARVGTTKAHHMLDNIGGGVGRLPNEATRKRMAAFIDALPAAPPGAPSPQAPQGPAVVLSAAVLERYVGEYATPAGTIATFRRDGTTLFVKPGTNPEAALVARSETRFSGPPGILFDFQLDPQGKVTGVMLEQGPTRVWMERK